MGCTSAIGEEKHLQIGCFSQCKGRQAFQIDGSCDFCGTDHNNGVGYCCRLDGQKNFCSRDITEPFRLQMRMNRHTCIYPSKIPNQQQRAYRALSMPSGYACAGDGQCLQSDIHQPMGNVLCSSNSETREDALTRCNFAKQQNKRCDGYISYIVDGERKYELVNRVTSQHQHECLQTISFKNKQPIYIAVEGQFANRAKSQRPQLQGHNSQQSLGARTSFPYQRVSSNQQGLVRNSAEYSKYSCAGDGQCLTSDIHQPSGNVLCSTNYIWLEDAKLRCTILKQRNKRCDGYISYKSQSGETLYELVNQATGNALNNECQATNSFQRLRPIFTSFSNGIAQPRNNQRRNSKNG